MSEQNEATKTLLALAYKYTHLVGDPASELPFALLNLAAGQGVKPDRQDGVSQVVFQTLWRSGWIEVELQASDLVKRLYRLSDSGRAEVERLQSIASEGAGI